MSRLQRTLIIWLKIFLLGLILHFLVYNLVTFVIGATGIVMEIIRLWKEIFTVGFFGILIFYVFKYKELKIFKHDKALRRLQWIFIALLLITFIFTIAKGLGVDMFVKAFKYDFIGYFIFFVSYYLWRYLPEGTTEKLSKWYILIIQWLLVFALVRWCAILIKPGVLKIFGYTTTTIEGRVGEQPPAVYWTGEHQGYPRNQFLFERPISWWFFLIAFFPLFYISVLQRKSLRKTWFRWAVFALNVILTFSRAAWGAWVVQLIIMGIASYRKNMKKYLVKVLIPLLIVLAAIAYFWRNEIIHRSFSNTGHLQLFLQWWEMFTESPLIGKWAGYVGPASHWDGGLAFNPENQYLQIMIEFGLIGFALWMAIYVFLNRVGIRDYLKVWKSKDKQLPLHYQMTLAMSVGMIGLSISGLVLHSFTDRMIVYPMMALFGLILAYHNSKLGKIEKKW